MAKRNAIIRAETVAVTCPYCGEPQPAPDNGSDAWMPKQVVDAAGNRTCVSCDAEFTLMPQSRVGVS
ncbi:MAG: hypothetical protein WC876_02010 [Candidatus Thermoplasmatota archaeon]|jgi:predicted RNA-binding Zn-ribbon protein involved in translation (DUF1610 family)